MSDDRSKQSPPPFDARDGAGGEFDDDEKTQLVDLDSLGPEGGRSNFAPPPTVESMSPPQQQEQVSHGRADDEATQMVDLGSVSGPRGQEGVTSSAPDFGPSPDPPAPRGGVSPGGPSGGQIQIGGDNPHQHEATEFVNVSDFAQQQAHFTPEQEAAGYDGNTQFVDVNALASSAGPGQGAHSIENDPELRRGYRFASEQITRRGEITLIEAQNQLGKQVLLKRVWQGSPESMTTPLRERIAQLNDLKHPNLMGMHGMFVTSSGMWVELDAPDGQRLTDLIERRGPHPQDTVIAWAKQIAHALEHIHNEQLAYANLTTDSVWISGEGKARLEPFDMLRLDDRGNLGVFGPPEMDAPPDQRQLSPATDVYSLAAVIAAALTGLPLKANSLSEYDDQKISKTLLQSLSPHPEQRHQSAGEMADELQGGLDIKIVGGAVAAGMLLLLILLSLITGGDDPADQLPADDAQATAEAAQHQPPAVAETEQIDDETEQRDSSSMTITDDPRLTIETSYELNPPSEGTPLASDEQLATWRKQAENAIADAESASSNSAKFDSYRTALEYLSDVIRGQDEPPQADWDAWRQVYENSVVQRELEELYKSFYEPLLEGRIGTAARRYERIARINPEADADTFLRAYTYAHVSPLGTADEDDDD